jgi:MerR family transcriptional regulator, repressor of the yfmOP operon
MKTENEVIEQWLSSEEVCKILRISSRTLQNYRDKREIPFYQIGRKIYYKASDVNRFLERHHIKARYQMEVHYE